MALFVQEDWIAAGLDSFQTRIDWDGKLMPKPERKRKCLCGETIIRSAYIFNPLTKESRHIGVCCYARFVNNVIRKYCTRCHHAHQCKTQLCKACRGPKISLGIHDSSYLSDIAESDPSYFDWMYRCYIDDDVRAWFERNKLLVDKIRRELYHDGVKFQFGKHVGKTMAYVLEKDPKYFKWYRATIERRRDTIAIHCWIDLNEQRVVAAL